MVDYTINGRECHIGELRGLTLVDIMIPIGTLYTDKLTFTSSDGKTFLMTHVQDCCEQVHLSDVVGDLRDLVGSPILIAEETCNQVVDRNKDESATWTFYKLATQKGYVTMVRNIKRLLQ